MNPTMNPIVNSKLNRRDAIRTTLATAAVGYHFGGGPPAVANGPNERLNIACIGVGGRGGANVSGVKNQNLVALVDVDENRAGKAFSEHGKAARYADYRKMFDELGSRLDAVVISTPDHTHFHPAHAAMEMGLHVYLEKPLAHNVWETRTLTEMARQRGLATQLGAQRHAMTNMHRVVELIQAGAIGNVTEVHSWVGGSRGMPEIPSDRPPVPEHLNYDLWLGPAPDRPYHPSFCPYGWRFWWNYGTGETGNWGCHILDIPFWALGLQYPTRVDASGPEVDPDRTPKSMLVTFRFPASDSHGTVDLHWYHGKPPILERHGFSDRGNNTLFIGDDGMLLCGFDRRELLPAEDFAGYEPPEPSIPPSPGFHREWIEACKGGPAATCHFDYSGPLAEAVLLGNVAYRAGGFDWDAETLRTGSNPDAQKLIRESYRAGWEV